MTTSSWLQQARDIAEAATAGEWRPGQTHGQVDFDAVWSTLDTTIALSMSPADARYLAVFSPDAVLRLLDIADALAHVEAVLTLESTHGVRKSLRAARSALARLEDASVVRGLDDDSA